MTVTEDTELRRRVDDMLQAVQPSAVPLDAIVRRGNGIRLRRAGAAAVALGPALPGIAFGFVQLPVGLSGIVINGRRDVPAVIVAACGYRYHVAGFAYSLAQVLRITVDDPPPGWPSVFVMPRVASHPPGTTVTAHTAGLWINAGRARSAAASGVVASEGVPGQGWSIRVMCGTGGDCYSFSASGSLGRDQTGACGPVGTPDGPETITALPLGFSYGDPGQRASGATGYAVQVSPGTAHLEAVLSDGSSELVTALEEQRSEKYRHALIAVVSIGVRTGQTRVAPRR